MPVAVAVRVEEPVAVRVAVPVREEAIPPVVEASNTCPSSMVASVKVLNVVVASSVTVIALDKKASASPEIPNCKRGVPSFQPVP